eukprot:4012988-Pyramimonas_sp.AAC.1
MSCHPSSNRVMLRPGGCVRPALSPAIQHRREGRIRQNACSALPQGRRRHLALLQLRRLVGPLSDHI